MALISRPKAIESLTRGPIDYSLNSLTILSIKQSVPSGQSNHQWHHHTDGQIREKEDPQMGQSESSRTHLRSSSGALRGPGPAPCSPPCCGHSG